MEDETFLLVSLKEEKSKKIAEAISNKTSRKIIDYLTEKKEATESEISAKLEIPLPTVHYNIELLKEAKLIETKEFFWSKKGKEMKVYKLSNKIVIISPSDDKNVMDKLKSILPIAIIGTFLGIILKLIQNSKLKALEVTQEKLNQAIPDTGRVGQEAFEQEVLQITQNATGTVPTPLSGGVIYSINVTWFLIGLYLALLLILFWNVIFSKRKK